MLVLHRGSLSDLDGVAQSRGFMCDVRDDNPHLGRISKKLTKTDDDDCN